MFAAEHPFSLILMDQAHDFQVLAFKGEEAISQPYRFHVELVSERSRIDLESLLHQLAFLAFDRNGTGIHGQIERIEQGDIGQRLTHYSLTLVPRLSYLQYRVNKRIFQHKSVPEIIQAVLKDHMLFSDTCQFRLTSRYPAREYCVQYAESDLQFIQRLCEEEGLHYHFEHSQQAHTLVFADHWNLFSKLAFALRFHPTSGLQPEGQVVQRMSMRLQARSTRTTRRGHDFQKAGRQLEYDAAPDPALRQPDLEDYAYSSSLKGEDRGRPLVQRALQSRRSDYRQADGLSDHLALRSGHFVQLNDHPCKDWNIIWLLNRLEHEGKQPQVLEENTPAPNDHSRFTQGYRNRFTATPWETPFRPPLTGTRPRISGSQTAEVTGPANEDIHCDPYGRVKVQFHWDRHGQRNDWSSCWLRVASNWAGDAYGGITIPRIGMEVLVSFLDGDPDQPIISGCLPNSSNSPPYDLPTHKTRSVLRSRSSPHSGGFNELQIEDRAGQELIYLRAQRDMEQNISHDSRLEIGNDRLETIKGNSISVLESQEQRTVTGDRKVQIKADDYLHIDSNSHTRVGQVMAVEAGQQVHIKCGANVIIDAGASITLNAGGQHLLISAAGLFSSSPVKQGGAPLPGNGALSALPSSVAALQALTINVQKQAFRQAAQKTAPVCAVCHMLKAQTP